MCSCDSLLGEAHEHQSTWKFEFYETHSHCTNSSNPPQYVDLFPAEDYKCFEP